MMLGSLNARPSHFATAGNNVFGDMPVREFKNGGRSMDFVVQRHDGSVSDNSGLGKCRLELVIAVLQERRVSDISRSR